MRPILSICIPTYNRAEYLKATLASIVDQANENIEIVVSDNASNDETLEVVEYFRKRHSALVYFRHPENIGADKNYLKVIEIATGEYCWLFGSDDLMLPGAIATIMTEITSGLDVYLCGLTLGTREMKPIANHHVLRQGKVCEFNLSCEVERLEYFARAMTTTAFFSFIGSIIVNREKWNYAALDEKFIGTLWVHVAKCFGILPLGFRLKFIDKPLLLKRGDNDSFMDKGLVHRIGISVNGYLMIGRHFFGEGSPELLHIKRTLRYEWPLIVYVALCDELRSHESDSRRHLDNMFLECFDGNDLRGFVARWTYQSGTGRRLYRLSHHFTQQIKGWVRG